MHNGRAVAIPVPLEDDLEDVHMALSAATTLWERGEGTEALKWLRRAAGVAADGDADRRALELAKAAADVASEVDARHSQRPPPARPEQAPSHPFALRPQLMRAPPIMPIAVPIAPRQIAPRQIAPRQIAPQSQAPVRARRSPPPPAPRKAPPTPPPSRPTPPPPLAKRSDAPVHREGRPRAPAHSPPPMDLDIPTPARQPMPVVPAVPPEPRVLNLRRLDFQLDESEEDTFIRPETMLRRALMAIDPDYAQRTEYIDGPEGEQAAEAAEESQEDRDSDADETQTQTQRRRKKSVPLDKPAPSGSLPALRVAVLPIPEDGDVRLLFLPPGAEPPPGVAIALLVPPTERDAELLAKVYAECAAKL